MVIVDTTVWIDYLNGVSTPEVEWFEREASRQRLGLLDVNVCEVLQGVPTDATAARVLRHLRRFEIFDTGGVALAAGAAHNYRALRARGRTVRKTIGCLIATFCLERDHCDRDFDASRTSFICRSSARAPRRRFGRRHNTTGRDLCGAQMGPTLD